MSEQLNKIAFCGLYCGGCEHYVKTQQGDLKKLAERIEASEKLVSCDGCRTDNVSLYCINCSLKKCAKNKGLIHCGECDEFPCSPLKAFENDGCPHHENITEELKQLKVDGVDAFLEKNSKQWSCKKCGSAVSWYQPKCDNCQADLDCLKW